MDASWQAGHRHGGHLLEADATKGKVRRAPQPSALGFLSAAGDSLAGLAPVWRVAWLPVAGLMPGLGIALAYAWRTEPATTVNRRDFARFSAARDEHWESPA